MEQSICEPDVAQSECYRETHLKEELLCSDLESLLLCRLEVLFLADIAHCKEVKEDRVSALFLRDTTALQIEWHSCTPYRCRWAVATAKKRDSLKAITS